MENVAVDSEATAEIPLEGSIPRSQPEATPDSAGEQLQPEMTAGSPGVQPQPEYMAEAPALQPQPESTDIAAIPEPQPAREKQQGRFPPGTSGNPSGRPKGSRNKKTLALEAMLDGEAEAIIRKLIEKAKEGEMVALRLILDRVSPVRRDRRVEFDLPDIKTAADAKLASAAVIGACANGDLSPSEAEQIVGLITTCLQVIQAADFEARLSMLEKGGRS